MRDVGDEARAGEAHNQWGCPRVGGVGGGILEESMERLNAWGVRARDEKSRRRIANGEV